VHVQETTQVEFGLLHDLDLADVHVSQRVDVAAELLDVLGDRIGNQFGDDLLQIAAADLLVDDLDHLPADALHLGVLGIGRLAMRIALILGEGNGEQAHNVAVSGLHIRECLDGGLLLLDHRAQLVGGQVHAVEVGQTGLALGLLDDQLELAEGILVAVQVTQ